MLSLHEQILCRIMSVSLWPLILSSAKSDSHSTEAACWGSVGYSESRKRQNPKLLKSTLGAHSMWVCFPKDQLADTFTKDWYEGGISDLTLDQYTNGSMHTHFIHYSSWERRLSMRTVLSLKHMYRWMSGWRRGVGSPWEGHDHLPVGQDCDADVTGGHSWMVPLERQKHIKLWRRHSSCWK